MALLTGNDASWEWAAEVARETGAARGWPDGGAALSDAILGYVDMGRDPEDPDWWATLAATVEELPYDGAAKLANVYRQAGGMTERGAELDHEASALGILEGTVSATVDDVAGAAEVAKDAGKGLGKLLKSPFGWLLAAGAVGVGISVAKRRA